MAWATTTDLEVAVSPSDAATLATLISGSAAWVAGVLAEAQSQIDPCRLPDPTTQVQAHALLTLHLIASSGELPSGASTGAVTAESNGPASRSMATIKAAAEGGPFAALTTTPYGRRYLPYARAMAAIGAVTSNGCMPVGC